MNHYYTYIYLDPRIPGRWDSPTATLLFEPFYVGKGKGNRLYHLLWHKGKNHKSYRIANIFKDGLIPIVLKIYEELSEQQALDNESDLIQALGTRSYIIGVPPGPLTNLKLSGTTQTYSSESKQKMSVAASSRIRKPHSQETKNKMSQAIANRTPEQRAAKSAAISAATTGLKRSVQQCEFLSKLHRGKIISQDHRDRISKALRGHITSASVREHISKRQQKTWTLLSEDTGETFTIIDLIGWCKTKNINYNTLHGTMKRNKFHKGYKILTREGGSHYLNQ